MVDFSDDDLKRGKVVQPAWYTLKIKSVGENPSKDGGSTNYPVEGIIIQNADDGSKDFEGVPVSWNFNSKYRSAMIGYLAALGITAEVGKRYDLSATEGSVLDVFVENDTWDGRVINRVNHKYRATQAQQA